MRVRLLLVLGFVWMAASGSGGCHLFRPATPEPPRTGTVFIPSYSEPDTTLATLAAAVGLKAANSGQEIYLGAFADTTRDGRSFRATFDPLTVASFGRPAPEWDLTLERNFYGYFVTLPVSGTAEYLMEWFEDPSFGHDDIDETAGTALIHRQYRVTAIPQDSAPLVIANGFADLNLIRTSDGRWVIVRWEDREDSRTDLGTEALSYGRRRLESQ